MNIGDRVRLLHDNAEGIIRKFLKNGTVEVEIEDGFGIPVLPTDLVKIATIENEYFGEVKAKSPNIQKRKNKKEQPKHTVISEVGFYIAFEPINDQLLSVKCINNTDLEMLVVFGEFQNNGQYYGIKSLKIRPREVEKVYELSLAKFEKWNDFFVQALFFKSGFGVPKKPIARKLSFKANRFFKSKQLAPILEKEVYLYQIDGQQIPSRSNEFYEAKENVQKLENQVIHPEKIRQSMLEGKQDNHSNHVETQKNNLNKLHEVDLHIEKIIDNHDQLDSKQYLPNQLDVFQKELEKAHMNNTSEVVFIHGVGNGVLRNEIHRRLAKTDFIQYFKDARKEKFGYGATHVKLK